MTIVLPWEKGEGNHREGRMTGTRDRSDVAVSLGEIEEPRTKPRPLAWSLRWLVSFTELGHSEEEQDWGGGGRRSEFGFGPSVRWNYPNGNV